MKKILFMIVIGVALFGYGVHQYVNALNKYRTLQYKMTGVDSMARIIKEKDSILIIKTNKIKDIELQNNKIKKQLDKTAHKYHLTQKAFIRIKAMNDSIMHLKFNTHKKDSTLYFESYFDVFRIKGKCYGKKINADLEQMKPIILNIGIYGKKKKYATLIKTNSKLLYFDIANVSYIAPTKKWYDNVDMVGGISLNRLGYDFGVYWNGYGVQYIQYINEFNLLFNYKTSIGNLWRMIKQ